MPKPRAPCILEQRVVRDRADRTVLEQFGIEHALQPVAAILQRAADLFRPVARLAGAEQRAHGRDRLRADDRRHLAFAASDGGGELADQLLVGLPAGRLENGAPRVGTDPAPDRARRIVRPAERRLRIGARDFELANCADRIDRTRRVAGGTGVGKRGFQRFAGQIHVGQHAIARVLGTLRGLPDPDDNGCQLVDFGHRGCSSSPARLATDACWTRPLSATRSVAS